MRIFTRVLTVALAAAIALVVSLSVQGAAVGQAETKRSAEHDAYMNCISAVKEQLAHPESADFGVYRVQHASRLSDWNFSGNFTATTTGGHVGVASFGCNVQPFNGF